MSEPLNEVLALVPARAGSKGIAHKNLAPVAERPLLAWTVEVARLAPSVSRVLVTTDSERIARVARDCGAEVPFLRPPELARDDTPGVAPLLHALRWLELHESYAPQWVVCLQPTSPLRTADDVERALALARQRCADSVVSVTPATQHPRWTKRVDGAGRLHDLPGAGPAPPRRQDLEPVYALNGAIYLARREVLLERESFHGERSFAYIMPRERSLDVDQPFDLELADWLLRRRAGA